MSNEDHVWTGLWGFFLLFGWAIIGFAVYFVLSWFIGRTGRQISAIAERRIAYGSCGIGILAWAMMWGAYGGSKYFWFNVRGSVFLVAAIATLAGLATLGDRVFADLPPRNEDSR
jgi:hypothetical protein